MASSVIGKEYIVVEATGSTGSVTANNKVVKAFTDLGMSIPSGYEAVNATAVIIGTGSTDSTTSFYGNNGSTTDWGVIIRNMSTTARTWTIRLIVICKKS